MNNYRKFVTVFLLVEIILMIGCNGMLRKAWKENQEKSYRVDIQRAVKEMKAFFPAFFF